MKLTTLVEDESLNNNLRSIHGVSFFIESDDGFKVLFDTGQKDIFLQNAKKLSINPLEANLCMISHNHYDHSGGLSYLLKQGFSNPVYLHENFFVDRYSIKNGQIVPSVGITSNEIEGFKNIKFIKNNLTKVHNNIYILSNVNFTNDFEKINPNFVVKKDDSVIQDTFKDEISMIIESEKGLIVISGCSHRGIINILTEVKKHFNKNIYAFVGGTHLIGADKIRLEKTVGNLKYFNLSVLGACHCTGETGMSILSQNFEKSFIRVKTGTCIDFNK